MLEQPVESLGQEGLRLPMLRFPPQRSSPEDGMENKRKQHGFTLIEIIAVIVLLGVLAAVIVPKFTDLTSDAQQAAAMQAVAEGIARVNSEAAKSILTNGVAPATLTIANLDTDAGDYSLAYSNDAANSAVNITATHTATGKTASGMAYLPQ